MWHTLNLEGTLGKSKPNEKCRYFTKAYEKCASKGSKVWNILWNEAAVGNSIVQA